MSLVANVICAYLDSIDRVEASRLCCITASTVNVLWVYVASELIDLLSHEADDGTYIFILPLARTLFRNARRVCILYDRR